MTKDHSMLIEKMPNLDRPVMDTGFDGRSNALDAVTDSPPYLILSLDAISFNRLHPDVFIASPRRVHRR